MHNLAEVTTYIRETRRLEGLPSSTETTFYPDLKALMNALQVPAPQLPARFLDGIGDEVRGAGERAPGP